MWVDTDAVGYVRDGGVWVPFGPEGGPVYEGINWPYPPSLTDADDGQPYEMGIRFHLLAPKACVGARWRVPDSLIAPTGGIYYATLWYALNEQMAATKAFVPVPGGYQDILFDTPVDLDASPTEYVVSVYTRKYVYATPPTPGDTWEVTSASGNVVGTKGQLALSGTHEYPGSTFNGLYYVSPLVAV